MINGAPKNTEKIGISTVLLFLTKFFLYWFDGRRPESPGDSGRINYFENVPNVGGALVEDSLSVW